METVNQFRMFFSMFASSMPIVLVCVVAGFVILSRWNESPAASRWALMGFGLAFALCFAVPAVHAFVQTTLMQGQTNTQRATMYTVLAMLWSVLHAAVYGLLLVAIFAGRSTPQTPAPPPASPPGTPVQRP
jgi:hypothetical protein